MQAALNAATTSRPAHKSHVLLLVGGAILVLAIMVWSAFSQRAIFFHHIPLSDGFIRIEIREGRLRFDGKTPTSAGVSSYPHLARVPGILSYLWYVTNIGMATTPPRPGATWLSWHSRIHLGVFIAILMLYPAIVSRDARSLLKWAGLGCCIAIFAKLVVAFRVAATSRNYSPERLFLDLAVQFFVVLIPTALLFLWAMKAEKKPGYCARCGYNLTGNVSGRCPECAAPVGGTIPDPA